MDQTRHIFGQRLAPFTDLGEANRRAGTGSRFEEGEFVLLGDVSRAWFDGSTWIVGVAGPAPKRRKKTEVEDD